MSHFSIGRTTELDSGYILAPERYDPRKLSNGTTTMASRHRVFDLVELRREILTKAAASSRGKYTVLDTGSAKDGLLTLSSATSGSRDCIGSAKKAVYPGDIIISRLRPYLRQVAFIDIDSWEANVQLLCSTEFYVLKPKDQASIAFMVPFLLSRRTQEILAAAQEGGHHPRFSDRVLTNLMIPNSVMERRAHLSATLENAIRSIRLFEVDLSAMAREVDVAMEAIC